MPILVKSDDVRSGWKAKARHGRLRAALESSVFFKFLSSRSFVKSRRLWDLIKIISLTYLDLWSNESSRQNLAEKAANFAGCRLLYTTLGVNGLITCSYSRKSVWRKINLERLIQDSIYGNSHAYVTLDRWLNYLAQKKKNAWSQVKRTRVSKSHRIHRWNHKYRLAIQVLHGSRKTFRSWITKNNFLNSCFTENKIS